MPKFETVITNSRKVICEGELKNSELGHPAIYLLIHEEKQSVKCPYCSKEFVFKEKE